jgi:hypothetical protein
VDPATIAATVIVSAMAKDSWNWVKRQVVGFFRRAGRDAATIEQRLEAARAEIAKADAAEVEEVRTRIQGAWQARLEDTAADDPSLRSELAALAERLGKAVTISTSEGAVSQNAFAFDNSQQANQGHGVQSNVFHSRESD